MVGKRLHHNGLMALVILAHLVMSLVNGAHLRTTVSVETADGQTVMMPICTVGGVAWQEIRLGGDDSAEPGPTDGTEEPRADLCLGLLTATAGLAAPADGPALLIPHPAARRIALPGPQRLVSSAPARHRSARGPPALS